MSNSSGPINPNNPVNPQQSEPIKPGTDKFKNLMKVGSSPEKQKKRGKRDEERRADKKAKLQAGPAEPDKTAKASKKETPKIQKVGESDKKQPKHERRSEETTTELAREEAAALAQKKSTQPLEFTINEDETGKELNKSAFSSQAKKELEQIIEEEQAIVQHEEVGEKFQKALSKQEETKKDTNKEIQSAPASSTLGPLFLTAPAETAPAYALLDAQTLALFEKMVSLITILKDSGVTETTLHLTGPEFANSQYYGAQVTIREYSTAPLSYNIEFFGNPLATDLFRKNLTQLRSSFNDPKYRFRINRLEASISRVERKKESSEEE